MRLHRVWQRVGAPTWKRSGTIVFTAVIAVLLIGGTAMAANLGLLSYGAPGDRGYRLDVPRPALSVSLPPTTSTSSGVDSTSGSAEVEGDVDDGVGDDDAGSDDDVVDPSAELERSADDDGDDDGDRTDDDSGDDDDDGDDDGDDESDADSDDAVSTSKQESDGEERARSDTDVRGVNGPRPLPAGDGRLDDD